MRPILKAPQHPSRHASFAVYDRETGRVVHLFHVELMPGAAIPLVTDLEKLGRESASRAHNLGEETLGVLAIQADALEPNATYVVDTATSTLRSVERKAGV